MHLRRIELLGGVAMILAAVAFFWWESSRRPPESALQLPADRVVAIMEERARARRAVVQRLLGNELTLLQAAAEFRGINANPPEYPCKFRWDYPGDSEAEKLCRQVLSWAKRESEGDPVIAELECELAFLLVTNQLDLP